MRYLKVAGFQPLLVPSGTFLYEEPGWKVYLQVLKRVWTRYA